MAGGGCEEQEEEGGGGAGGEEQGVQVGGTAEGGEMAVVRCGVDGQGDGAGLDGGSYGARTWTRSSFRGEIEVELGGGSYGGRQNYAGLGGDEAVRCSSDAHSECNKSSSDKPGCIGSIERRAP